MRKLYILLLVCLAISTKAQQPHNPSASELLLKLKKLNFLGKVLYVAAHPDDENTRFIAYMSNERLANTAYLSMTRGDGGQNLIGPEIREGLGIIRTQELLAARRIDGGQQFFTRANDFGYSKSPEETQKIWNRDQVLEDVIWTYRKFRPDVIVTRFPANGGGGHGHHTTSAIFANEAFNLAADKDVHPEQLKYHTVWQPKRLYLNTGRWWNPNINADEPGVLTVDVGEYNSLLGTSYTEMAARSRSQHKSQGFGSTGRRGENLEFLELRAGEAAENDIFDGIETTWKRVGAEAIGQQIDEIIAKFDPNNPAAIVEDLLAVRDDITLIQDDHWKKIKIAELDEIVQGLMGLYLEATVSDYTATPGSTVTVSVEAINRSTIPVKLEMVTYDHLYDTLMSVDLVENGVFSYETKVAIPASWDYSQPYWLKEPGTLGTYKVEDQLLRGLPENTPELDVRFSVDVAGHKLIYTTPVVYKWNDPVEGELYRPFSITPEVFVSIPESVYIFNSTNSKQIEVTVKAGKDDVNGEVALNIDKSWKVSPEVHSFSLDRKGAETRVKFTVTPPAKESAANVTVQATVGQQVYDQSLEVIDYDHIPAQVYMPTAQANLVRLEIAKYGNSVAYIQGAGDEIPAALREIGYEVTEFTEDQVTAEAVQGFDAVVLGIRALNTNERAGIYMPVLLEYVKNGGTLMIQYNTSHRLKTDVIGPYPLTLSRHRIAEEDAELTILAPKHPALNSPNKIKPTDFDNWVQERGLYFPSSWDEKYTPLLSGHDTGEEDKQGGLLVTTYGKGHFVYSGYSWFRQLPAGVPGAYKLFVNLISLGNEKKVN